MALEKKIFSGGGMDMDTDERFMAKEDYKKAVNCRITKSDEGNDGIIENIRANMRHTNPKIDDGDVVIGAYEDRSTQSVIYFVHAKDGDHGIYRRPDTGNIQTIIQDPILNFNLNHLITGINVVGSDEDVFPEGLLYWTDDYNPPRKINIDKGINNLYVTIDEQTLDAVKYPPTEPPTSVGFLTDSDNKSNQLKEKSWQFKYRYIYDDLEESAWSPISRNFVDESFQAHHLNNSGVNSYDHNALPIAINTGHHTVKRIQIAARNTNGIDDFFLISDIKKENVNEFILSYIPTLTFSSTVEELNIPSTVTDNSILYFLFYNNSIYPTIDTIESNKLYDDVPHLAKAQEIVDGNRLVYGNVLSGQSVDKVINYSLNAVIPDSASLTTNTSAESLMVIHRLRSVGTQVGNTKKRKFKKHFEMMIKIPPLPANSLTTYHLEIENFITGNSSFAYYANSASNGYPWTYHQSMSIINLDFQSNSYDSTVWNNATVAADLVSQLNSAPPGQYHTDIFNYSVSSGISTTTSENWSVDTWTNSQGVVNQYLKLTISTNSSPEYKWSTAGGSDNDIWSTHNGGGWDKNNNWESYTTPWYGFDEIASLNQFSGRYPQTTHQLFSGRQMHLDPSLNSSAPNGFVNYGVCYYEFNTTSGELSICNSAHITWGAWEEANTHWGGVGCNYPTGTNSYGVSLMNAYQTNYTPDAALIAESLLVNIDDEVIASSFKSGAEHRFGLVYYDRANRSSSVQTAKKNHIYIPKITESTPLSPDGYIGEWHVNWEIHHEPPEWATHYQWVYGGNSLTNEFIHFVTDGFYDGSGATKDSGETEETSTGELIPIAKGTYKDNILVDITNIRKFREGDSGLSTFNYTYKEGDVLRIVLNDNNTLPTPATSTPYEFKVLGVVGQGEMPGIIHSKHAVDNPITGNAESEFDDKDFLVLTREKILTTNPLLDVLGNNIPNTPLTTSPIPALVDYSCEIYTPVKQGIDDGDIIFYEIGEVGRIATSGGDKVHKKIGGNGYWDWSVTPPVWVPSTYQDQIIGTQPATGTFKYGDIYLRVRKSHAAVGYTYIESFHFSDKFKSDYYDKGRPNAVLEGFKRSRKHSTCLYSEPYIPNTNINGLNSILPDVNFAEFERDYNSIQKLHSRDNKLIIFQEDKVSQSLVNRNVIYNVDGSGNVATSDSVLSQAVPYLGNYGINKNPESFASYGNRMYFTDMKRGAVLRLSNDGFTPVSEYKMKNFFTDNFRDIRQQRGNNHHRVLGVYDTEFNEYVISSEGLWTQKLVQDKDGNWIMVNDKILIKPYTVGFCESANKWNSFYSYLPEMMCTNGTGIVSFNEGNIYRHNISGVYLNQQGEVSNYNLYNKFYGVDYDSELWVVSNDAASNNKIYKSFSQESDDVWEVNFESPNGQETQLLIPNFDTKENIHYSDIMNDKNSPGGIIEGDKMRDVSLLAKMKVFSNSLSRVFAVNFNFSPSHRSNK